MRQDRYVQYARTRQGRRTIRQAQRMQSGGWMPSMWGFVLTFVIVLVLAHLGGYV